METKDTMLFCRDDDAIYGSVIDDEDFKIFDRLTNDDNQVPRKSTSDIKSSSSSSLTRRKDGRQLKKKSRESTRRHAGAAVIENPPQVISPWATVDDSSITPDIDDERRRDLIKFYANPLDGLPASISVK
jgi:hypothetical protein